MARWAVVFLVFLAAAPAPPTVTSMTPGVVQRGTEIDLVFAGKALADVASVVISGDGLTAEIQKDPNDKTLTARLKVAADAAPGNREIRLMGPSGVSNPMILYVGLLPVIYEKEPNTEPQPIELPATVVGIVHAATEVDRFRFAAKKGQRLIFNAYAMRIGSRLDVSLALHNAAGRQVARSEDTYAFDALLEWVVPDDGPYVLTVRDHLYAGSNQHFYRLDAGAIPVVESIFPLGGRRGETVEISVSGRNLDGVSGMKLSLDPDAPLGRRDVTAKTPIGPSNPFPFQVGDLPEVSELEPETPPVTPPVVINGRIDPPGDVDTFVFTAGEQKDLVFEVVANRYGSPLDALITLTDAKGNVLKLNDDSMGADARIQMKNLKKGAVYRISIRDLVDRGGPRFAYRLSIQPPRPAAADFAVRFIPDTLTVSRGSHTRVWCEVTRRGLFKGEVALAFTDLPKGVTAQPQSGYFSLFAAPDAPLGPVPLRLIATGEIDGKQVTRIAEPERAAQRVRQAFVTVLDAPPFTVEPVGSASEEELESVQAETKELETILKTHTPELDAAQARWEKAEAAHRRWFILKPQEYTSTGDVVLTPQPDHSLLASGPNPGTATYTVKVRTSLAGITALRLEALPDKSFPASGPGRAPNGNFVLGEFKVKAGDVPLTLHSPVHDFAQAGFPTANTLDGKKNTGWATSPQFGKRRTAIYKLKKPLGDGSEIALDFTLEHQSTYQLHVIGRFRLAATAATNPSLVSMLSDAVAAVLDVPRDERSDAQKLEIAAYYRSIAPALDATRHRLAELRSRAAMFPPKTARNAVTQLGVAVRRREGFTGDIVLRVEGFSTGRNPKTRMPNPIATSIQVVSLTLKGGQTHGLISLKALPASQLGTRNILIRGQSGTWIEYSRAFPLAVVATAPKIVPGGPRAPDIVELVNGLQFDYYEGDWQKLPDFGKLTPAKTGSAKTFGISLRNRNDNFGFRFTGYVEVPRDGDYIFSTVSDDGSKLTIGDIEVVDNDGLHGPLERAGQISLKAGKHKITVTQFERAGGEFLEVYYQGPGIPRQKIPEAVLFRPKS